MAETKADFTETFVALENYAQAEGGQEALREVRDECWGEERSNEQCCSMNNSFATSLRSLVADTVPTST